VELKPVVEEKMLAMAGLMVKGGRLIPAVSLTAKAGRTLSAESHSVLSGARDKIKEGFDALHTFVEANKPANATDDKTTGKPDTHASAHMPTTDPDNPSVEKNESVQRLATKAIAAAYRSESTDDAIADLEASAKTLRDAASALREQQLAAFVGG
jgi:hypothetical protein